jgi:hypothetical protein
MPLSDPLLPENAVAGSWQLEQLVPGGLERVASKKIDCPTLSRAVNGGTVCGGIRSTIRGVSAGRTASGVPPRNVAGIEVETDPESDLVSGACFWHAPTSREKATQAAVVP